MFSNRNPFINEHCKTHRRQSQFDRQVHACFAEPPPIFHAPRVDSFFHRLYWGVRSAQFRVFYKTEEVDDNSFNELVKFEPSERPPSIDQICESTRHMFSNKWIKYMYAKFKNECPSGRMRVAEFKRLFGAYIPTRTSDAYLERMFGAFSHASPYNDQLTFKDLVVCLSVLHDCDAKANAEWVMRLINGNKSSEISYEELKEFVLSVYLLTGNDPSKRADSVITTLRPIDERALHQVSSRAALLFREWDRDNRGYITQEDIENLFRTKENVVI